jgi:thiol-disulfide isomerase/thioredoxin
LLILADNNKFISTKKAPMKNLLSIVFCVYCSIFFSSVFSQERDLPLLPIGAAAPDFSLRGVDDIIYSLKNFEKNSVLVVVFWANHCPTAQAYEDRLIAMVKKYSPKGVGFAVISPNSPQAVSVGELGYSDLGDDFDDMVIRARDKKYNFPYLYDGDDHAGSIPYGPVATPHVFIFDKERTLQYRGRIDNMENPYEEPSSTDAVDAIEALLAGKNSCCAGNPNIWMLRKMAMETGMEAYGSKAMGSLARKP